MNYLEGRILTLEGTQRFRVENRGQKTVFVKKYGACFKTFKKFLSIADAFGSRSECIVSHNEAY